MSGTHTRGRSQQEASDNEHRITARTVRTPTSVETEYRVDGTIVGSAAEVAALLEGRR
jgi:hypothetical protein